MKILLHPTLFPNIATFVAIVHSEGIVFEACDNYQKQTYRNRTNIYGANGKLTLTVPVSFTQKNRQLYKDVAIHNDENWQAIIWKSLESAYKTSPYFEFYEDELKPLFTSTDTTIYDFNIKCFEVICECLQLDIPHTFTKEFIVTPSTLSDFRKLSNARKEQDFNFESYTQVFNSKHGFIPNLSILDLLFNEGPNALNYLESQDINF